MSLGTGSPRGCPPTTPSFSPVSTDCAAPRRTPVSFGMCHKQHCPSPSSTGHRPHAVLQGVLFPLNTWSASYKRPCETGRMGIAITLISQMRKPSRREGK